MSISRDKKGDWAPDKKSSGPPMWLRVVSPISNLASLRKGGKVRSKKRMKARS